MLKVPPVKRPQSIHYVEDTNLSLRFLRKTGFSGGVMFPHHIHFSIKLCLLMSVHF